MGQYVHQVLLSTLQNGEHMKAPCSPLRKAPSVQLIVPKSVLSKEAIKLGESQLYFIHLLTTRVLRSGKPPMHFYPLQLDFLRKQLGTMPRERQIQPLVDIGYVLVQLNKNGEETYQVGVRPKSYRLSDNLIKEALEHRIKAFYTKEDSILSKRLFSLRLGHIEQAIADTPTLAREYNWLCILEFDHIKARDFQYQFELTGRRGSTRYTREASLRLESDIQVLSHLKSGDFTFKYNGIRLTTAVANAIRELRSCLMDDKGNYFVELDMRSSQVVFLCKALVHFYSDSQNTIGTADYLWAFNGKAVDLEKTKGVLPSDAVAFVNHVVFGDIYKELYLLETAHSDEWIRLEEDLAVKSTIVASNQPMTVDRGDFKISVMKDILFNYYTRKSIIPTIAKAFNESYPSVTQFLELLASQSTSKERSRDLARLVQKYEAHFFHFIALDLLEAQFPDRTFYVVHDSIGIPEDIVEDAKVLLNEAIAKHLGLPSDLGLIRH